MESVHGTTDTLKHKSCVNLTNKCLKTKHIISVGRIELPRSLRSVKVVGTQKLAQSSQGRDLEI